jgi:hypothetical protein
MELSILQKQYRWKLESQFAVSLTFIVAAKNKASYDGQLVISLSVYIDYWVAIFCLRYALRTKKQ